MSCFLGEALEITLSSLCVEILFKDKVRLLTNKYKRYRRRMKEARTRLKEIAKDFPNLSVHWQYGYTP
ncbi:MAG: hypothetical protein R3E32_23055 [Chitinophagales bacterium]